MERRDHGAEPQSGQLLRTRGFGLRPFSFTGGAMGARHAYWSRIAERRGEKEDNKLALRKKLLRKSSRTNRVGRLLCSSPCSSLSCGFSVGRHPRPVPGPAALRAELAASSAPSCPNSLTRCITHSHHASQGASLTPRTSCYGERSSQHKRMVLAGWRGSGLPLIASWPRAPRPVCQRSDEGVHLIAAGSPPSR